MIQQEVVESTLGDVQHVIDEEERKRLDELSMYEALSAERKRLQEEGEMPMHWTTGSWQLFKEKYLYDATTPKQQYRRIARTLAKHTPDPAHWEAKFFDIIWKGWLSLSTPVLANTGTDRGLPVSCAGNYIPDSIYGIYESRQETAMLTKMGFGTSGYLGDIRHRGQPIFGGGTALGVLPIIQLQQADMEYVSQGTARRGSWAGYLPIDHGDFYEVCTYLEQHPDGNNIGWNISDEFLARLEARDEEAINRYAAALRTKMITGKGYFWFTDKANERVPQWYKDRGLKIKHSNLCVEIALFDGPYAEPEKVYFGLNDRNYINVEAGKQEDHTFTCVLSSVNLAMFEQWKNTDLIFTATVFLDCVCQEFIERARNVKGLENAVRFTIKSRALGLGVCGFHSLLQDKMIPFESFEAHNLNSLIFKKLDEESLAASKWLASVHGEPLWTKGYGVANTHRIAIAPTKSSAMFVGGVSEGINPDTAMVYTQRSAGGEIDRINPYFLKLMIERDQYKPEVVKRIREAAGSVQDEDWLTDHEKAVFKTAYEMNQRAIIRLAVGRARYIDQWQSLNLFIGHWVPAEEVNEVHKELFKCREIKGAYYVYGQADVQGSTGDSAVDKIQPEQSTKSAAQRIADDECLACS